MNLTQRRSGYGILDLRHHVARRIQQEWDAVEQPAQRPWRDAPRAFHDPVPAPPLPDVIGRTGPRLAA